MAGFAWFAADGGTDNCAERSIDSNSLGEPVDAATASRCPKKRASVTGVAKVTPETHETSEASKRRRDGALQIDADPCPICDSHERLPHTLRSYILPACLAHALFRDSRCPVCRSRGVHTCATPEGPTASLCVAGHKLRRRHSQRVREGGARPPAPRRHSPRATAVPLHRAFVLRRRAHGRAGHVHDGFASCRAGLACALLMLANMVGHIVPTARKKRSRRRRAARAISPKTVSDSSALHWKVRPSRAPSSTSCSAASAARASRSSSCRVARGAAVALALGAAAPPRARGTAPQPAGSSSSTICARPATKWRARRARRAACPTRGTCGRSRHRPLRRDEGSASRRARWASARAQPAVGVVAAAAAAAAAAGGGAAAPARTTVTFAPRRLSTAHTTNWSSAHGRVARRARARAERPVRRRPRRKTWKPVLPSRAAARAPSQSARFGANT